MRFSPTPWLVASLAFIVLGFSRGIHSSFGVFNVALLDTFGWSRGATAGIFSVVLIVDAVLSPVVGYLLDRYGTKKISIAGCLALILGLILSSQVSALWQLYVCFGIILAVGFTFVGMVPHVFLVSEWFSTNRASAIGFVYAGTGLGIMLLAPLSEWLISNYGWARAFELYALIVLVGLLPVVWLFYQHGPYGEHLRHRAEKKPGENQWTAKLALQSLQFWLLFIARIAAASGTTVIVTHQVAHVVDVGFSKFLSASIFGLAGITSSFGRVIFGFIADRLSKQAAYTLNIAMTVVGVSALMVLQQSESNLAALRLRHFFRHWLRLARGHFFRAHRGYFFRQRFRVDSWLFDRRGRGRRRARLLVRWRVLRLDRELLGFLRLLGVGAVRFGYLHLARRRAFRGGLR